MQGVPIYQAPGADPAGTLLLYVMGTPAGAAAAPPQPLQHQVQDYHHAHGARAGTPAGPAAAASAYWQPQPQQQQHAPPLPQPFGERPALMAGAGPSPPQAQQAQPLQWQAQQQRPPEGWSAAGLAAAGAHPAHQPLHGADWRAPQGAPVTVAAGGPYPSSVHQPQQPFRQQRAPDGWVASSAADQRAAPRPPEGWPAALPPAAQAHEPRLRTPPPSGWADAAPFVPGQPLQQRGARHQAPEQPADTWPDALPDMGPPQARPVQPARSHAHGGWEPADHAAGGGYEADSGWPGSAPPEMGPTLPPQQPAWAPAPGAWCDAGAPETAREAQRGTWARPARVPDAAGWDAPETEPGFRAPGERRAGVAAHPDHPAERGGWPLAPARAAAAQGARRGPDARLDGGPVWGDQGGPAAGGWQEPAAGPPPPGRDERVRTGFRPYRAPPVFAEHRASQARALVPAPIVSRRGLFPGLVSAILPQCLPFTRGHPCPFKSRRDVAAAGVQGDPPPPHAPAVPAGCAAAPRAPGAAAPHAATGGDGRRAGHPHEPGARAAAPPQSVRRSADAHASGPAGAAPAARPARSGEWDREPGGTGASGARGRRAPYLAPHPALPQSNGSANGGARPAGAARRAVPVTLDAQPGSEAPASINVRAHADKGAPRDAAAAALADGDARSWGAEPTPLPRAARVREPAADSARSASRAGPPGSQVGPGSRPLLPRLRSVPTLSPREGPARDHAAAPGSPGARRRRRPLAAVVAEQDWVARPQGPAPPGGAGAPAELRRAGPGGAGGRAPPVPAHDWERAAQAAAAVGERAAAERRQRQADARAFSRPGYWTDSGGAEAGGAASADGASSGSGADPAPRSWPARPGPGQRAQAAAADRGSGPGAAHGDSVSAPASASSSRSSAVRAAPAGAAEWGTDGKAAPARPPSRRAQQPERHAAAGPEGVASPAAASADTTLAAGQQGASGDAAAGPPASARPAPLPGLHLGLAAAALRAAGVRGGLGQGAQARASARRERAPAGGGESAARATAAGAPARSERPGAAPAAAGDRREAAHGASQAAAPPDPGAKEPADVPRPPPAAAGDGDSAQGAAIQAPAAAAASPAGPAAALGGCSGDTRARPDEAGSEGGPTRGGTEAGRQGGASGGVGGREPDQAHADAGLQGRARALRARQERLLERVAALAAAWDARRA